MRSKFVLALLATPAFVTSVLAATSFDPVNAPEHQYTGGWHYYVGGGLASFDCDDDQLPELFAAGGTSPAILLRNRSTVGGEIKLLADTPSALALTGLTGAYPLDIDSDGKIDLVLLSTGKNQLMQGLGNCQFDAFENLTLGEQAKWSTAFSATWQLDNILPTLALGNYVDRDNPDGPFGTCDSNELYKPEGDTYPAPQTLRPGYCALSMLFSDWSRTARPELRISNDRHYYVRDGSEQLWRMDEMPSLYTEADGWKTHQLWGMGIASRDVSGDGLPDVYLSSMGDQRLQTQSTPDKPTFVDAPYSWGTTAHRPHTGNDGRPSTGWHTAFGDVNNDSLDDIFIAKGNVEQMPGSAMQDPNSLLLATAPQQWAEIAEEAGVASFHRSRGAALVDLNQDGKLDLAVNNRRASLQVWQNNSSDTGHWLSVSLSQPAPNQHAIGAWIEVKKGETQAREITVGGGHAGGSFGPEHFGLGQADQVEIRVIWPDGEASVWRSYNANQRIVITR